MKSLRVRSASRQRGSIYTTMIVVALVAIFMVAALKVVPAYIDNDVIKNAMEGLREDHDIATMGIAEVRTRLMRTLNTNRVEGFDARNVVIVREGGKEYIDINYEARVPLFYNIDAIVTFENRFDKF